MNLALVTGLCTSTKFGSLLSSAVVSSMIHSAWSSVILPSWKKCSFRNFAFGSWRPWLLTVKNSSSVGISRVGGGT